MKVIVRWWDGYVQVYDNVEEWRAGSDLLWIRQTYADKDLPSIKERHIPLAHVRWFSPYPTDRQYVEQKING